MKRGVIILTSILCIVLSIIILGILLSIYLDSELKRIDDLHAVLYFGTAVFFVAGSLIIIIVGSIICSSILFFCGCSEKKTWLTISIHISFLILAFFTTFLAIYPINAESFSKIKYFYYHEPYRALVLIIFILLFSKLLYSIVIAILKKRATKNVLENEIITNNVKRSISKQDSLCIFFFCISVFLILMLVICATDYFMIARTAWPTSSKVIEGVLLSIRTKNIIPLVIGILISVSTLILLLLKRKRKG